MAPRERGAAVRCQQQEGPASSARRRGRAGPGRGLGPLSQWVPQEESGRREIVRDVRASSPHAASPEARYSVPAPTTRAAPRSPPDPSPGHLRVPGPCARARRPTRSETRAARPGCTARPGDRSERPGPCERAAYLIAGIHDRAGLRRRLWLQRVRGRLRPRDCDCESDSARSHDPRSSSSARPPLWFIGPQALAAATRVCVLERGRGRRAGGGAWGTSGAGLRGEGAREASALL